MSESSPVATISGGFADHAAGCQWSCFGSEGGVSSGRYKYGNVGLAVGDDPFAVEWNRQRIKETVGAQFLLSARQVHGTDVFSLTEPLLQDTEIEGYDSLVTNQSGVALMIQQADCQAVLLFDPVQRVVAALHSGWRGSVQNIIAKTVAVMVADFGSQAKHMHAFISPSLGPCCGEFIHYKEELPEDFFQYMVTPNHFDFWQISKKQLVETGLVPSQIACAAVCTVCDTNYFSYRRACRKTDGITGRNSSLIVLD